MTFGLSFTLACVYPLFHCLRLSRRGHVDGVFRHLPGLKHLYRDKVISEWQEINEKMNSARWKYGVISFLGFLREGSDSVCGFQFSVWEQIYGTWIKALVFKNIVYSGIKKNRLLLKVMPTPHTFRGQISAENRYWRAVKERGRELSSNFEYMWGNNNLFVFAHC